MRLDDARVAQGATHELLHLRRWWLEGVPLLYHGVSDVKARCEQLENELEHQVIVPREADYGFDPFARWNGVYGEKWRGQPFSLFEERAVVRQSCMMDWLGTNLITDERAVMLMEQKIKEMGFLEEADDFSRGVRRRLHDKAQTVAFLCKCMGYAEGVVRLRIYNAVAGTISEEAVPSLSAN